MEKRPKADTADSPSEEGRVRDLALRLIASDFSQQDAARDSLSATKLACERMYDVLSRWVGSSGADTIFRRSLLQASTEHPHLSRIRIILSNGPEMEGVSDITRENGKEVTAAALEALLIANLLLLSRLIGFDLVERLTQQKVSPGQPNNNDT
jgi:hypothetical protein